MKIIYIKCWIHENHFLFVKTFIFTRSLFDIPFFVSDLLETDIKFVVVAEEFLISFLTSNLVSLVNSTFLELVKLLVEVFSVTLVDLKLSLSLNFFSDLSIFKSSSLTSGSLFEPCLTTFAEEKYLLEGLLSWGSDSSFVFEFVFEVLLEW